MSPQLFDPDQPPEEVGRCPACGDPTDYCQGHGELGDPAGRAVLDAHDAGDHSSCHPEGCEEEPAPPSGAQLRDEGAARAAANTAPPWNEEADAAIAHLAASGRAFTSDDLRAIVGPPPGHPNAMGARFLAARRAGLIREVGFRRSDRPDAHARRLIEYRGAGDG